MSNASGNKKDLSKRKGQHIELCLDNDSQGISTFSKYRLPYNALPEISLDQVDTSTELFGKQLKQPLIIASMTGGSEHGRAINTNIAKAAEICGVAMGVGSQRIGLELKDAKQTFELVREHAPNAFIIANIGAVQLNYGHDIESMRSIISMVGADALYLHLNPLQEALQPGGDTDFRDLESKISRIIKGIDIPVFIKEVGHGISAEVALRLENIGVAAVDVAGVGGTSYAWVEARRASVGDFEKWFKGYGVASDKAIAEVSEVVSKNVKVISSGGVRSPIDGLVGRALGANYYSAAVPFLEAAMTSSDKTIEVVQRWQDGLRIAMFGCGVTSWDEARKLKISTQ